MKNALSRLLTDSEFSLPAPRTELSKECTRFLQSKEDEPGMREFTDILCGKLTSIATTSLGKLTESHSKRRENLWKSFYQFRCIELPTIWKELLDKLQVPQKFHSDPWLPQVIARLVMEAIVKATCPLEGASVARYVDHSWSVLVHSSQKTFVLKVSCYCEPRTEHTYVCYYVR